MIFIYKQLRIHQVTQTSISDNTAKKSVHKIWRIALPSAPLALISMGVAVSFIFVQLYLGFNIFKVISRFGGYAPPGVMISAITLLIVIILWALALAGVSLLRLRFRLRTQDK